MATENIFLWFVFGLGATVLTVISAAVLLEILAIKVLKIDGRPGLLPYHPVFATGNFYQQVTNLNQLATMPEGPMGYGYYYDRGIYIYDPKLNKPDLLKRTEFFFRDGHTNSIGRANNPGDEELRICVIGGSTAAGSSASSASKTWSSVLEKKLSRELNKEVLVLNAAVASFVTSQERLCLELAVLPRQPDMVIIINGQNDVDLALTGGLRPGDPPGTGWFYGKLYHPGSRVFFENSAVLRYLTHNRHVAALRENCARILADPDRLELLTHGIIETYCENMAAMYDRCSQMGVDCVGFLQPNRNLTYLQQGDPFKIEKMDEHMRPLYKIWNSIYTGITAQMLASEFRGRFYSLSDVMNSFEPNSVYTDACHFTDGGHEVFADAVRLILAPRLRTISEAKDNRKPINTHSRP